MKINADNTNLNLRHLRALHAIRATGSFARAADLLGVVPSALTETIRQLEESAGLPLFDRRMRPPQLTPAGEELLAETGPALMALDRALTRLQEAALLGRGELRIGASPSTITDIVAPALGRFRRDHPGIGLWLHDGPAETLAQMVIDGALDLAVAGYAGQSPQLEQIELARDPVGLALPADHPLTQIDRPLRLEDVNPDEVIHLNAGAGTMRLLAGHPDLPDRLKSGLLRVESTFGQLCLIRSGAGIGLLPRKAVLLFDDPKITFLPVSNLKLERRILLLLPARRPISHIANTFAAVLGKAGP